MSPSARFLAARAHDGRRRPADAGGARQALRCACAGANDGEKAKVCAAGIEHEATSATSAAPTGMVGRGLQSYAHAGQCASHGKTAARPQVCPPARAIPWLQVRECGEQLCMRSCVAPPLRARVRVCPRAALPLALVLTCALVVVQRRACDCRSGAAVRGR